MFGFSMISIEEEERFAATAIQAAKERERRKREDPLGVEIQQARADRKRLEYIMKIRTGQADARLDGERYTGRFFLRVNFKLGDSL